MESDHWPDDPTPARMVAGALAHLACHLATGCPRAAQRATLLLERVVGDAESDPYLREHARDLIDIIEREQAVQSPCGGAPIRRAA